MGHVWLLIKFEVFLKGPKLIGHIIGQSGDNEFRKTKDPTKPRYRMTPSRVYFHYFYLMNRYLNKCRVRSVIYSSKWFEKYKWFLEHWTSNSELEFQSKMHEISGRDREIWWQWCWWHCDFGDSKLVIICCCWRLNFDVGDIFNLGAWAALR